MIFLFPRYSLKKHRTSARSGALAIADLMGRNVEPDSVSMAGSPGFNFNSVAIRGIMLF